MSNLSAVAMEEEHVRRIGTMKVFLNGKYFVRHR